MRLVTQITGLSADTIRAWERRHGAVRPARTQGNTRRYSSREVRRLLLLREATLRGHAIGSIATLNIEQLESLLADDPLGLALSFSRSRDPGELARDIRSAYLGALSRYDSRGGFELLARALGELEPSNLVDDVLGPVAEDIGGRECLAAVARGHRGLFGHHLHGLCASLGLRRAVDSTEARRALVGAASEAQEIPAMLVCVCSGLFGWEPVYAGSGLGASDLAWATEMAQPDTVVFVSNEAEAPAEWLSQPILILPPDQRDWWEPLSSWLSEIEALHSTGSFRTKHVSVEDAS